MTSRSSLWVSLMQNNKRRLWQWCLMVLLFAVLPVLVFLILIMSINESQYLINYGSKAYDQIRQEVHRYASVFIGASGGLKPVIVTFGAALTALGGFSYINDRVKLDFYESMPQKKSSRFFVIWINGIVMFILTYVTGMLLGFAVLTVSGYGDLYTMNEAIRDLGNITLYYLGVYHLFILSMMITGTVFAGICAFAVLSSYEAIIRLMIAAFKGIFFRYKYVLSEFMEPVVSPYGLYLKVIAEADRTNGDPSKYLIMLGVFDLAVFIVSLLVYMKRPREKAGRTLVFKWMAEPLKILMAVPAVTAAGLITAQTMNANGLLNVRNMVLIGVIILIASIIACALIQGVFELDIRQAFKKKIQWIVCAVLALMIFFGFKQDILGIDRYVPDPSEVASAVFAPEGYDGLWGGRIGADLKYMDMVDFYRENMYLTDAESICELAGLSMEKYDEAWDKVNDDPDLFYGSDENNMFSQAILLYRMKNGRLIAREISIPVKDDRAAELVDKIMSTQEFVRGFYSVEVYDADTAISDTPAMQLEARFTDGVHDRRLDKDELIELIEMYKKDMETFSYKERINLLPAGYIRYSISTQESRFYGPIQEESLVVYPCMKNCIKYINDKGYSLDGFSLYDEAEAVIITNPHYDEQNEYMMEEGLDYLPDELQERFIKSKEYSGTDLKELEAFLYPGDIGMYRWDGGKDFDVSYEVQIVYKRGGEKAKRFGDLNYYYFVKDGVPENVVKDLAL